MNKREIKSILNYLATVTTWSLFVLLFILAGFLAYYFLSFLNYKDTGEVPAYSIYTIVSPSMTPFIKTYDMIVNSKVESPEDLQVGDIITFTSSASISDGLTVTHRIKKVYIIDGTYYYVTKGDNNVVEDSSPVPFENVIGKVFLKFPQFGRVQAFVATKFGWVLVVIVPALIVIIKDILKLIKITKARKAADLVNRQMINQVEGNFNNERQ